VSKEFSRRAKKGQELIRSWAKAFCKEENLDFESFLPRLDVSADVAVGLVKALDHRILEVDDRGYFALPSLKKPGTSKQFICRDQSKASLSSEWFTHVAVIDELTTDCGWPPSLVDFETLPFDAVAYLPNDLKSPIIVTEAKCDLTEFEKLTTIIEEGINNGFDLDSLKQTKGDYRKYWGLLGKWLSRSAGELRIKHVTPPKWFLIAAPGQRICYSVSSNENELQLTQISALPTYRDVERNLV
jgi:hypothetical protein